MLCCLIQCFKVGCKQRRLTTLAFVIFTGFFLILQNLSPTPQLQTKSLENGEIVKILGQRNGRRHLSDEKENEDDTKRNGKQETIRKLRIFAKGLQRQKTPNLVFFPPHLEWLPFLSEPGQHFKGRKKRIAEIFQHRTDRLKKVGLDCQFSLKRKKRKSDNMV